MKTNKELLRIAITQLGNGGSKYRTYVGASGNWCNMFVYWLFNANGCASLLPLPKTNYRRTYCPSSIKWCNSNLAQIPPFLAMPCDIIYFDWEPNGNPNHIGIVESRVSTSAIKTIEGNTSGGKVARKTRNVKYVQAIFRPHFAPTGLKKKKLNDSNDIFEYASIYNLQIALGIKPTGILTKETVKYLQRAAGTTPDGVWGNGTSKAVQRMTGLKVIDGAFGTNSVKALKKWINKKNGYTVKTTTKKPAPKKSEPSKAEKAVSWARKIAKDGGYTYKHWKNKDKKTKLCPICHKLKGKYKGWNCIGFVSAAWYHGAGLKTITCSCSGIGTDNFFTKVSENSWRKRNGKDWIMISVGSKGGKDIPADKLKVGDILVCYDGNGKFHHVVLYTGNGKYIDCTNTSKKHIAERKYSNLCKRYHVTRAFRYTGK